MNVHQITLSGYTASAGTDANCVSGLYLGTAGSYGVEQLDVVQSAGWENLSVTAIFQPCGVKITVPAEGGTIDVPWEATADALPYPQGRVVFQGYADGELINTCDIVYTVSGHSATAGTDPQPPTPDQYQQFVKEVQASAEAAANSATEAAGSASAAAGSASAAAGSAQQAADTLQQVQEAGQQATEAIGTAQSDAIKAVGDAQSAAVQAVQGQQQTSVGAVQAAGTAAVDQVSQAGQQQVQAVKDEGTAQIGAMAEAGSAQVQAVQQAGSQQITDIGEAGAQQVQAVNSAGDTKLDQINTAIAHPPQPNTATGFWQVWNAETGQYEDTTALYQGGYYTPSVADDGTLTWTGSQAGMPELPSANIRGPQGLGIPTPSADAAGQVPTVNDTGDGYLLTGPYAPLEASIRPTVSGNPAVCEDSVAWSFQGLRIYGKSTQDGTPSPENPVPIVSAGEGGSVELFLSSTNVYNPDDYSTAGAYGLNVEKNEQSIRIYGNYSGRLSDPTFSILTKTKTLNHDVYKPKLARPSASALIVSVRWTNNESDNIAFDGRNFVTGEYVDFSIEIGIFFVGASDTSEPYVEPQSITLSTPSGLPGIPVENGGNYTDASGQQLACNYRDYNSEKDFQWIGKTVVDGSTIKFVVNSASTLFNLPSNSFPKIAYKAKFLCNYFPGDIFASNSNYDFAFCRVERMKDFGINSNDEFNQLCQQWNSSGNPLTIYYTMDEPIETSISPEEIAAYRALQTYPGTTVVSTAEPVAGIEARYILDGTAAYTKITAALAQLSAANTQTSQTVNTMLGASE